ncbi:recombinase RecT [Streptomyces sp. ASQP_92]|uniref:recombinase RecT n=1 Tax=Streptomyces sp. ASQP_92 TaxID=2979116 RepID=UPI0021BF8BB3|nr:recombinase RecT [Streptomyces sp. ASQP_92]MCT9092922.1 recombinase RecT [Streptomyces sp. ASQP_92]
MTPHEAWLFCQSLSDTPLLPDAYRRNAASVLWAMEYGRALGLDVVTTITTIHVIKGKPTQSADLMLSRTRSAGHKVRIRQEPGQCTVSIWRTDDPEFENAITWTYDDAVTAGLCEIRNNRPYSRSQKGEPQSWEKYPRAMLRARAIAEAVRSACPEVLHGAIYTPEELGARVDSEGLPMEAEVHQLRRVEPGQTDQWATPAATVQAATADLPSESLTPAGRDYLHEAHAAPDAATVRLIWQDAKTEGARPEYLAQIAEVGQQKSAAEKTKADDVVDGEIVDEPADEHADAIAELRVAAAEARLDDFENGAATALGMPIEKASTVAIRALAAQIRPAA